MSAENEVGSGEAALTELVSLKTHANVPSPPTAPLEITPVGPHTLTVEWGAPESDGGAPLEGYKVGLSVSGKLITINNSQLSTLPLTSFFTIRPDLTSA